MEDVLLENANVDKTTLEYAKKLDEDLSEFIEDEYGQHTVHECVKSYVEYMLNIEDIPKNISVLSLMRGYSRYCSKLCLYVDELAELIDNQIHDKIDMTECLVNLTFSYNNLTMEYLKKLIVNRCQAYRNDCYEGGAVKLHKDYYKIYDELHIEFYRIISLLTHDKYKPGRWVNILGETIVKNMIKKNTDETLILKALKIISDYHMSSGYDSYFTFLLKYDGLHPRDVHRIYYEILPGESGSNCICHRCTVYKYISLTRTYKDCCDENSKLRHINRKYKEEIKELKYDSSRTYYKDTIFEVNPKDIPELMNILYRDYKDVLSNIHLMLCSGKTSEKAVFKNGNMVDVRMKYSERRPILVRYVDKELYFESIVQAAVHFNTTEVTLKKYVDEAKLYLKSCIIEYTDVPRDRFSRDYDYQPLSRVKANNDIKKLIENASISKTVKTVPCNDMEKVRNTPRYNGPVVALDEGNSREFWFRSVRMASKGLSMTESKVRSYIKSGKKTSGNYAIRESNIEEEHNYKYDKQLDVFVRYLGNDNRYLGKCFRGD